MDIQKKETLRKALTYCIENFETNKAVSRILEFIENDREITKQLSINGVMQAKPEKVCPMCNEYKGEDNHTVCEDCGGRSF